MQGRIVSIRVNDAKFIQPLFDAQIRRSARSPSVKFLLNKSNFHTVKRMADAFLANDCKNSPLIASTQFVDKTGTGSLLVRLKHIAAD